MDLTVETLQADLAELRKLVTALKAQVTELSISQGAPPPPMGASPCTPPHRKERQQPLEVPSLPQCTGWVSLAIPSSIRRPWDVLQEDLGDKIEDARVHGKAAPADVADQQAAILTKGARDVFCELPRQERLALTEVSLTELAAYTMWKACILDGLAEDEATPAESTLHTAWDLVSDEDKPEWVPDSPRTCLAADPFWALLLEAEPRPDPPSRRSRSPSSCSSERSGGSPTPEVAEQRATHGCATGVYLTVAEQESFGTGVIFTVAEQRAIQARVARAYDRLEAL